jgi:hypothetical protein
MGLTACTEPQCLYKGALYLLLEPFPNKKTNLKQEDFTAFVFSLYNLSENFLQEGKTKKE